MNELASMGQPTILCEEIMEDLSFSLKIIKHCCQSFEKILKNATKWDSIPVCNQQVEQLSNNILLIFQMANQYSKYNDLNLLQHKMIVDRWVIRIKELVLMHKTPITRASNIMKYVVVVLQGAIGKYQKTQKLHSFLLHVYQGYVESLRMIKIKFDCFGLDKDKASLPEASRKINPEHTPTCRKGVFEFTEHFKKYECMGLDYTNFRLVYAQSKLNAANLEASQNQKNKSISQSRQEYYQSYSLFMGRHKRKNKDIFLKHNSVDFSKKENSIANISKGKFITQLDSPPKNNDATLPQCFSATKARNIWGKTNKNTLKLSKVNVSGVQFTCYSKLMGRSVDSKREVVKQRINQENKASKQGTQKKGSYLWVRALKNFPANTSKQQNVLKKVVTNIVK